MNTVNIFLIPARNIPSTTCPRGIFEDLYVNGGHSILVDTLTEEENRINLKLFKGYKKIGDKIKLLTYINQKAIPINDDFRYEMYHISTGEEEGIYANGILTESFNLAMSKYL